MSTSIASSQEMFRRRPWILGKNCSALLEALYLKESSRLLVSPLTDAATTAIYLAASPTVKECDVRGLYFVPIAKEEKPSTVAQDDDLASNLWYLSHRKVAETLGNDWSG